MPDINVVVYSSVLFNRTGVVRTWMDKIESQFTAHAIRQAPVNKRPNKGRSAYPVGALRASIRGNVTRVGPTALEATTSVNVPYATYVLFGTHAFTTKKKMALPSNPGFGVGGRRSVKGQWANNFLLGAAYSTSRTHSSLRGMAFRGM